MSQPVKKFEMFPIQVAIWQGEFGFNITAPQKSYKDKQTGAYKTTNSLSGGEALVGAELLMQAARWAIRANEVARSSGGSNSPATEKHGHEPDIRRQGPPAQVSEAGAPPANDEDVPF